MAKTKKNKRGLAEAVTKKKSGVTKLNPFDLRTVRPKQSVLGRKTKNDVGKPGIARAKAIQIRKDTLLQEYKIRNKSNMFMDKRIGEKDSNLSAEDKMIARYTAERLKNTGKQSIFNLGDDQELTHRGAEISAMNNFTNPQSDDEGEEEERLNAKFVGEAHFGGFMTRADDDFKEGRGNTRKEWIESLIRESKKRKSEKKKLDEETEEKTLELDQNWRTLMGNLKGAGIMKRGGHGVEEEEEGGNKEYDPYDMLVRQMTFEKKEARGSERLKTEEETIREEKERLERMEADRLRRMRGEAVEVAAGGGVRVSVEDMNDPEVKKKNKLSKKEKRQLLKQLLKGEEGEEDKEGEEDEAGEEGQEEEDEDDEEDGSDDDDSDEDEEDNYSDLEDDEEEEEQGGVAENEKDRYDASTQAMMSAAAAELPFYFTVPETYEELAAHVAGRSLADRSIVMERILSCNHPSLGEGNKEKLGTFFSFLLQYVQDCASAYDPEEGRGGDPNSLEVIGLEAIQNITPTLFKLTGMFQQVAAKAVQEVIQEKFEEFWSLARKRFPGLDTLLFIKIVLLLFPSSDYRHPVVTPCYTFITSILSQARPVDRPSFASGLILATLLTESILLSRRYIPELVNFLLGVFHVASTQPPSRPLPPCKGGDYLVIRSKAAALPATPKLSLSEVVSVQDLTDEFRVSCLVAASRLTLQLLQLYAELPAAAEVFQPFLPLLASIDRRGGSEELVGLLGRIGEEVGRLPGKSGAIVKPAKQVQMLRMLEPKIEENFQPFEKKRTGDKAVLEEQKLRHKLKQERKGARKEIRKDVAFLADAKAREMRAKDAERRERTRALLGGLASQEGDYKQMLKKKKKF